jgi:hypothetical protein
MSSGNSQNGNAGNGGVVINGGTASESGSNGNSDNT